MCYVVDHIRCGKTARPGLCGGRWVTGVPTARGLNAMEKGGDKILWVAKEVKDYGIDKKKFGLD